MKQAPVVAHIVNRYFPVSANWLYNLVEHVEGWHSLVLAHMTENLSTVDSSATIFSRSRDLPRPVRLVDGALRRAFGEYPSFYSVARWHQAQLLHAHMGPMGYEALSLAERLDLPLITSFYGKDASQLPAEEPVWRRRYEQLFQRGDLFLVEGPHMGRQLQDLGCQSEKIEVSRIGVDLDRYPFKLRLREEGQPLRLLMVGRFVEKKGFVDGIEAFAQFVEGGGEGILNIVGDSDGSESSEEIKEQIIRAIEMHGLKDHVNLHGLLSPKELREHYYENHVLLVPSRTASTGDNEGGAPVTIIEAQSTGLPVIGTDHCDIPNLVKDGETGFIADEGDVSGLANIISHLYKEGGIDILGNRAKKFVEKKHDKKVVSSYIGSKYKNVKSKHG